MNHKWEDNKCVNCGIVREKRSWRLRMAMVGKDYYKYGKSWHYKKPEPSIILKQVFKVLGFERPDCKKPTTPITGSK